MYASNPISQKAEAGLSWIVCQPLLHREFQDSLGYIVTSFLKKKPALPSQNKTLHTKKKISDPRASTWAHRTDRETEATERRTENEDFLTLCRKPTGS